MSEQKGRITVTMSSPEIISCFKRKLGKRLKQALEEIAAETAADIHEQMQTEPSNILYCGEPIGSYSRRELYDIIRDQARTIAEYQRRNVELAERIK